MWQLTSAVICFEFLMQTSSGPARQSCWAERADALPPIRGRLTVPSAAHLLSCCEVSFLAGCFKVRPPELIHAERLICVLDHARPWQPLEVGGHVVSVDVHCTSSSSTT